MPFQINAVWHRHCQIITLDVSSNVHSHTVDACRDAWESLHTTCAQKNA